MAVNHLSLVNQKMAFANAILQRLDISTSELSSKQKLEQQALKDAVIFHLITALHFYLREIAENCRIKNLIQINSIEDLIGALSQADRASSEAEELNDLSQTADSWLSYLLQYRSQLLRSPEKPKEKKSFGQDNLIELVEVFESDINKCPELTPQLLTSCFDSFRALIMRQRETSAEF